MGWEDVLKQDTVTSVAEKIYQKVKDTPQLYSNGKISVTMTHYKSGDKRGSIHRVGKIQPLAWLGENDIDAKLHSSLYKDDDQKYIDLLNEVLEDPELNGPEAQKLREFIDETPGAYEDNLKWLKLRDYNKIWMREEQ